MFEVGEKVVYPNHGVSVVEEISSASFHDTDQVLFHLRLLSNNSKVMVPKENLELVGLRPLCDKTEIQELIDTLQNGQIDTYKDWKGRYKQNLDKMKTGRLTEVAEVLKNLCLVSQKKSLSFREKKMYERAKYFIVSEVAQVREIGDDDAETLVEDSLETSLEKLARTLEAKKGTKDDGAKDDGAKDDGAKDDGAKDDGAAAEPKQEAKEATDPATEGASEGPAARAEKADAAKTVKKAADKKPASKKGAEKAVAAKKPASSSRRKAS